MKIFIKELSDQAKHYEFDSTHPWVRDALLQVDERWKNLPPSLADREKKKSKYIQTQFDLRLVDDVVVIDGEIDTSVQLICSRCAKDFSQPIHESYTSLFTQDPVLAGMDHSNTTRGHQASQAHTFEDDGDISLIKEDCVDLAALLQEQLVLQIPYQPLCKTDCKGICSNCGCDLNEGRCACKKITSENPFSVLKDLSIRSKTKKTDKH